MTLNKQFGKLLSEGIVSAAKRQEKDISVIELEIAEELKYTTHTIQRWRRGYMPNDPDQIAFLTRFCATHGRVGRGWAQSLLTQSHFPNRETLLQELFPTHAQHADAPHVYQNLPDFLGRELDMERVLEGLASRWPLVSIEGLGGVGKTTLAIESARLCLPQSETPIDHPFDAIVWVSAKDRPEKKHWMNDVLDTIARVLDYPYITQLPTEQKPLEVDQLLTSRTAHSRDCGQL